jgi:hypothetical protein
MDEFDGWDMGILIRVKQWGKLHEGMVMGELVSEVGWLKGGETELQYRLKKLLDAKLLESVTEKGGRFYKLTHKAKERFLGLADAPPRNEERLKKRTVGFPV